MNPPRNIIAASIRMHYARLDGIARYAALQIELARIQRETHWLKVAAGIKASQGA